MGKRTITPGTRKAIKDATRSQYVHMPKLRIKTEADAKTAIYWIRDSRMALKERVKILTDLMNRSETSEIIRIFEGERAMIVKDMEKAEIN